MKTKLFLSLAAMLFIATANAATIAVLEVIIANDDVDLTVDETKFLSDELRRQATRILPKDYSVLTREKIISLIPETAENLTSAIDIGRAIKSDYVTQGLIGKLGGLFTLTVELYETESGNLLSDFVKESTDLKGLLDAIRENAPELFAKIMPKEEPPVLATPAIAIPETVKDTQIVAIIIPTNIPTEPAKSNNSLWIALGLDVLGTAAVGFGIYNNSKLINYSNKSKNIIKDVTPEQYAKKKSEFNAKYKKAQNAETTRNIFYATGGALLLSGIAVHIWF